MTLFIVLLASVALGFSVRYWKIGRVGKSLWYLALLMVANLLDCLPYFTNDPDTWPTTFGSGLIMGAIPLLIVTGIPALISCLIVGRLLSKHEKA